MTTTGPEDFGLLERLSSLFRVYAIPDESIVVPRPFPRDDRSCFTFAVPDEWPSDESTLSAVKLLEDGLPLGPAHCAHDDIRTLGKGRYSHWGPAIYFSASDNTDPNGNGRVYSVVPPAGWSGVLPATSPPPARADGGLAAEPPSVEWSVHDVAPEGLEPLSGEAFVVSTPTAWPSDRESFSTLMVLEDDRPLPAPHARHADVERLGGGRYSHWSGEVRFSTSDGSDPRRNGRRYSLVWSDAFVLDHAARPPVREGERAWVLHDLPTQWTSDDEGVSRLWVLEDGRRLGPAHATHDELRALGGGRYSHWSKTLRFSTSDDSDPTTNGRTYTFVWGDVAP